MCNLAEIKTNNMKELKELGFEHMPTLNEFIKRNLDLPKDNIGAFSFRETVEKYRNLIDQQPKLGDFIPCIDGAPVDEPKFFYNSDSLSKLKGIDLDFALSVNEKVKQYQKALEQVKFEGWTIYHRNQYSTLIVNKSQMLNMVANGTLHGELFEDIYKTYEQAINYGVKFKIK